MSDSSDPNPYEAPSAEHTPVVRELPDAEALFSIPATSGKRKFQVTGFENRLQVREDDGKLAEVLRHEPLFVKLIDNIRAFTVKTPSETWGLIFGTEDYQTLKSWIGTPTTLDLREALGANGWWQLPVAALFFIPGPNQAFQWFLGVLMLMHWAGSKLRPHRCFFVPIALFFFLVFYDCAHTTYSAWQSGESLPFVTIAFGTVCLFLSRSYYRRFRTYRQLKSPYEPHPSSGAEIDAAGNSNTPNW